LGWALACRKRQTITDQRLGPLGDRFGGTGPSAALHLLNDGTASLSSTSALHLSPWRSKRGPSGFFGNLLAGC
jgi:hypothetical protein